MKYLLILALAFCVGNATCQIEATTKAGKTVLLKDDSTWSYKPITIDSTPVTGCERLIVTKTDNVTGDTYTGSIKKLIVSQDQKTGFWMSFYLSESFIGLTIKVFGVGSCIDTDAAIYILFKDGTRRTLRNTTEYNCDNKFYAMLGRKGDSAKYADVCVKDIDIIRVYNGDKSMERKFTTQNAIDFRKTMQCLTSL